MLCEDEDVSCEATFQSEQLGKTLHSNFTPVCMPMCLVRALLCENDCLHSVHLKVSFTSVCADMYHKVPVPIRQLTTYCTHVCSKAMSESIHRATLEEKR